MFCCTSGAKSRASSRWSSSTPVFCSTRRSGTETTWSRGSGSALLVVRPEIPRDEFIGAAHGDDIQRRNSDFGCAKNKVEPIAPLKRDAAAWVSGIRRDQSAERAEVPILLAVEGEPLKRCTRSRRSRRRDVHEYLRAHGHSGAPARGARVSLDRLRAVHALGSPGRGRARRRWAWTGEDGVRSPHRRARPTEARSGLT